MPGKGGLGSFSGIRGDPAAPLPPSEEYASQPMRTPAWLLYSFCSPPKSHQEVQKR